jgi:DNA-binding beta-propeller fold protein YncE
LRAWWKILGLCLIVSSCEECKEVPHRVVVRYYDGHLYRQYYRKGFEQFGRLFTFVIRNGRWVRIGDVSLADQVQGRGMVVDQFNVSDAPSLRQLFSLPGPNREASAKVRRRVYILDVNAAERVLSVDPESGAILSRLTLGQTGPAGFARSADGTRLYVLLRAQEAFPPDIPALPAALLILRANPLSIERRFTLPASIVPRLTERSLEVSLDGQSVFFIHEGRVVGGSLQDSSIVRLDLNTGAVIAQIPNPQTTAGFGPIALSPDGAILYAISSSRLTLIDTLSNTVATQVLMSTRNSLAVHPNGGAVYVSRGAPPGIIVFDGVSATVAGGIDLPNSRSRTDLYVTGDGRELIVNDDLGGKIYVINLVEGRVSQELDEPTAGAILGMAR